MLECLHQNYHVQGFTTDGEYMYWSFTDSLVKTNMNNTVISQVHVYGGHLGDIDYYKGKLYASLMGNSLAGEPWGNWTSFYIYVFDAGTLTLENMIRLDPCYKMRTAPKENHGFFGIDGVAVREGNNGETELWVAAGLEESPEYDKQMLFNFSMSGELLATKYFKTGNTVFGIQNLEYDEENDIFWFSTYGGDKDYQNKNMLISVDIKTEAIIKEYDIWTPYGFHALGNGRYLISYQCGVNGNREGYAEEVTLDQLLAGDDIYRRKGERKKEA